MILSIQIESVEREGQREFGLSLFIVFLGYRELTSQNGISIDIMVTRAVPYN